MVPMEIAHPRKQDEKRISRLPRKFVAMRAPGRCSDQITLGKSRANTRVFLQRRLKPWVPTNAGEVSQAQRSPVVLPSATGGGVADAVIESHEETATPQQHDDTTAGRSGRPPASAPYR